VCSPIHVSSAFAFPNVTGENKKPVDSSPIVQFVNNSIDQNP
jgi:hypothetical protein